ncbi:MAG: hypothetical protein QME21_16255 [Anaerolineales bacterium]|nr:hypothetical protein [Anaerolineales bacterium]
MRRHFTVILFSILLLAAALMLAFHPQAVRALPEYSAQTGEPCATCHLSPSGGGPRGPRGQAWVGSGKPGAVPALVEALSLLGIQLDVDESQYQAPDQPAPEAQPLAVEPAQADQVHQWLQNYDGN